MKTTKTHRAAGRQPDPIFAAIEAHKAAWAKFKALAKSVKAFTPSGDAKAGDACRAEGREIARLSTTLPTTPEGAAVLAAYIAKCWDERHGNFKDIEPPTNKRFFSNIAEALAPLRAKVGQ